MLLSIPHVLNVENLSIILKLNSGERFNFDYIRHNYPFIGNTHHLSAQVLIRKTPTAQERYYLHSFDVFAENVLIGTLSTDSTLPRANAPVKFEFANPVFYQKPGFVYYLDMLADAGLVEVDQNPSYFEIPCDVQLRKPLLPRLSHTERNSTLDEYNPRPKFRPLRHRLHVSKLANGTQYTFGLGVHNANGDGKQVVVYNKTEANAAQGKEYIDESHQSNGLAAHVDVERIEPRITARWLADKKIRISARDLANPEWLKKLFVKAVGDAFKFVECKPARKPKRNAQGNYTPPVTDLFPLAFLQAQALQLLAKPTTTAPAEISDYRKRIIHKGLVTQYVANGTDAAAALVSGFESTTTAPVGTTWPQLRSKYAQEFNDIPTPENNARITQLAA